MTRALFRKQMLEIFSWLYFDRRSGKRRSGRNALIFVGLYLYLFGFFGYLFYQMANTMSVFLATDYSWLYMALFGLIAVVLGSFGSIFNTYSSLYCSKDNDLLFAMPIPPAKILAVRLLGVYLLGLLYESIVMVPAVIVFFQKSNAGALGKLFAALIPIVLSFFVLTVSCALGYLVAWISSKLKHKNVITIVVSLAFLVGYFLLYNRMYSAMQNVFLYADALGDTLRWIYPFYQLGLASGGNALSMLIGTGIFAALFLLTCMVLSHSFVKLATTNRGSAKVQYKEKKLKRVGYRSALLRKEIRRFLASPVYMLNCGLGSVMMLLAAGFLLWKGSGYLDSFRSLVGEDLLLVCAIGAILATASVNDITAPSISLEGKSIWLTQSLPVPTFEILRAKWNLHMLLTLPPILVLTVAVLVLLLPAWYFWLLFLAAATLFVSMCAMIGLALNLKMPNLKWQSEVVPVKQSLCVILAMLIPWGCIGTLGALYWLIADWIRPVVFLAAVTALLLLGNFLLYTWLKNRGTKRFESL